MLEHEEWFGNGHTAVPGFLTSASAQTLSLLLADQLRRDVRGSLVEIGTYMGKTFIGLVKASRAGERVIGFDLFPAEVEQGFRSALSQLPADQQARVAGVRQDTRTLSATRWISLLQQPARFVHIDGGHSREAILADLALAGSALAADALVILDDFLHDWYPDLTEGIIDGLRAARAIVPVAIIPRSGPSRDGGTKLVCATPGSASHYRSLLQQAFASAAPSVRRLAGSEVLTFQRL
jgi:predicted O-methyltransferase YrrM